ncbi:tyrosine-type recombinase/integrase [Bacteroides uniformis]|uniref:tyrosine-type recombinase/integrase n=1 Tax=Bacteroides uniformis TaxID=820 RepID=UPI001D092190|nr:site-specific integrase [Bacteroides uniformis]MCB6980484.1 site-specific integrase [Bacteroides uniformis]MCB7028301.1 site-specific integrase [Bacteroides uniformis]
MASLKIKYRHSSIEGKAGTLFYQVIHNRVARQINSGYKIYPDEWDIFNSQIIIPAKTGENRHRYLVSLKKCIKEDTSRLKDIMIRFENLGYKYTADEIIEYYSAPPVNEYFVSFCENLIEQLRQIGKMRTTETYTTTLNSFKRFMHSRKRDRDIPFDNVDSNLMIEYEQYLKSQDICPNSTSYYMRNLRAMYNRAVEKELVIQRYPFKHVYTGIDKTIKRAVPAKIIRQIRDMDLSHDSSLEYARDLFMFSFYTRGMSFIDMAYLKKSNLQNGFLSYRRKKTNQQLLIKWEKPMQEIIDKYDTMGSSYLLPIIDPCNLRIEERTQYMYAAHRINRNLKAIGRELNLSVPLTMYVARHAWASIARSRNVPISVISEGMGHDSETTTRIYLASLENEAIDKANSMILKSL